MAAKKIKEKYYRKQVDFFLLILKIKLWPSRSGLLHGIKDIAVQEEWAQITTHCNERFSVRHSKRSRAARWLRNKWYFEGCKKCQIPAWKVEKYKKTHFSQHRGSLLWKESD
ncbi:pyrrolysine--tRNA(Pyl) ligase small subunit [Acidobacteriota bacterium]